MHSIDQHQIHRHPSAPWVELRVSENSRRCYQPHAHAEYSLGVVDHGQAIFHHPGGPQHVQAGSVVLIEPGVVHACNPDTASPWSYRMLFIKADWLHREVARHNPRSIHRVGGSGKPQGLVFLSRRLEDPGVWEVANRLCHPLQCTHDPQRLRRELPRWLAKLSCTEEAPTLDVDTDSAMLAPALAAMQECVGEPLAVRDLAASCGLSPTQFIRRFQGIFGMTPGKYLQNQRVNGARRLLAEGRSLVEAANEMGFADQAHMHRAFTVRHAMTPGRYRAVRDDGGVGEPSAGGLRSRAGP